MRKTLGGCRFKLKVKTGVSFARERGMMVLLSKVRYKFYKTLVPLPIWGDFFERVLLNQMIEFFTENKLMSSTQSCFKPEIHLVTRLFQ